MVSVAGRLVSKTMLLTRAPLRKVLMPRLVSACVGFEKEDGGEVGDEFAKPAAADWLNRTAS